LPEGVGRDVIVVAILLAVCLCLLLVLVGDISVTGMTSVMLMIVVERGMSWQLVLL